MTNWTKKKLGEHLKMNQLLQKGPLITNKKKINQPNSCPETDSFKLVKTKTIQKSLIMNGNLVGTTIQNYKCNNKIIKK